jgi:succinate dehydrogenase / fumarate reductase cytochrome b subunit
MAMESDHRHFYLRRLHSLAGIVPIGVYMFVHVYAINAMVLAGPTAFDRAAESLESAPWFMLLLIEILFIWLPIAFHGVYGLVIVREAEHNFTAYGYTRNAFYSLQRISGVIAFGFVAFHMYTTRFYNYLFGVPITYETMHGWMTNPVVFAVYLVGVLACVFHLTNGVSTFCITWGITVGARAQRAVVRACTLLFFVMGATGMIIVTAFR